MKLDDLPQAPARPHSFFALDSMKVPVKLPEREAPIRIHCKIAGNGPPLLLIHGLMTNGYSFRYIVPAFGPRYQKLLPAAELIWFDRASHFLQVDDPEGTVQGILRFDEQSR